MTSLLVAIAWVAANPSLPPPTGPSIVGTKTVYFESSAHDKKTGVAGPGLTVQFWFPARSKSKRVARYMSRELLDAMRFDQYLNVDLSMLAGWDELDTHSFVDAPPNAGRFPLLIFSPGFGMARCSYTTLAEELASQGIVVAIGDHPYQGLTLLPDGKLLNYALAKRKPPKRVREMAAELSFLRTKLLSGLGGVPKFDAKRVFACGHSLGGAAALQVGRTDPGFAGAIDLDGDVWGDVETSGTRIPFLVLLNQPGPPIHISDKMKKERDDGWKSVTALSPVQSTVLKVYPAYHFTFSDAPFLLPASELRKNGATLDPTEGRKIICGLIKSFIVGGTGGVRRAGKAAPNFSTLIQRN